MHVHMHGGSSFSSLFSSGLQGASLFLSLLFSGFGVHLNATYMGPYVHRYRKAFMVIYSILGISLACKIPSTCSARSSNSSSDPLWPINSSPIGTPWMADAVDGLNPALTYQLALHFLLNK